MRNERILSYSRNSSNFMETEGSLPHSQEPVRFRSPCVRLVTPKLEDNPLSAVCNWLLNISAATLHIWEAVRLSAIWGRAMPWWQEPTHTDENFPQPKYRAEYPQTASQDGHNCSVLLKDQARAFRICYFQICMSHEPNSFGFSMLLL
jgi:hypothetical protein